MSEYYSGAVVYRPGQVVKMTFNPVQTLQGFDWRDLKPGQSVWMGKDKFRDLDPLQLQQLLAVISREVSKRGFYLRYDPERLAYAITNPKD